MPANILYVDTPLEFEQTISSSGHRHHLLVKPSPEFEPRVRETLNSIWQVLFYIDPHEPELLAMSLQDLEQPLKDLQGLRLQLVAYMHRAKFGSGEHTWIDQLTDYLIVPRDGFFQAQQADRLIHVFRPNCNTGNRDLASCIQNGNIAISMWLDSDEVREKVGETPGWCEACCTKDLIAKTPCPDCENQDKTDVHCVFCNNTGFVKKSLAALYHVLLKQCPQCMGTGCHQNQTCSYCQGKKLVSLEHATMYEERKKIRELIEKGEALVESGLQWAPYLSWTVQAETFLSEILNLSHPYLLTFRKSCSHEAPVEPKMFGSNLALLRLIHEELTECTLVRSAAGTFEQEGNGAMAQRSNKVFIVHGHDNEAREMVARFVERLGFEAVILHEQVDRGLTVIEKLEQNSDVHFAVVVLTPDDIGHSQMAPQAKKPRARQNVILELGYFMGKLGRSRVCALVKGEVEHPSDYAGVVYVRLDEGGGWKNTLARNLDGAGLRVDFSKVR